MNAPSPVERAGAYVNVHLSRPTEPAAPVAPSAPPAPYITVSRESGTGGAELVGALLARTLPSEEGRGWAVFSANLIEEMLRSSRLPTDLARYLPEDRIPPAESYVEELMGLHPNLRGLVARTNDLIRRLARSGQVVLLGRGANFATADIPGGVHVRLVAPVSFRAERTARWLAVGLARARELNAARDAARRRYVQSNFGADISDPTAYDVVFNAARTPVDLMAAQIAALVQARVAVG